MPWASCYSIYIYTVQAVENSFSALNRATHSGGIRSLSREFLIRKSDFWSSIKRTYSEIMALAQTCTTLSTSFIDELLPSAQRVALLYNVSYLCLAEFPKLERMLRERAMETQILFGSSEAILLKCALTSDNLVRCLFPKLAVAVEKNEAMLAVQCLQKAKEWINDIVNEVEGLTQKYEEHCKDVATTVSDVITEKHNTEKKKEKLSKEIEAMKEGLEKYKNDQKEVTNKLGKIEQDLTTKFNELLRFDQGVFIPFREVLLLAANLHLKTEIRMLTAEKNRLRIEEWIIQKKVIYWQMKITKASIEVGSIPSPEHLPEVQAHLSKICEILLALLRFWDTVGKMLDSLNQTTFANEDMIEYLDVVKEQFLTSITEAKKVWKMFGEGCVRAKEVFSVQTKAYQFLEVNTSSLSKQAWQVAHDAVMEKLMQIEPSSTPAITDGTSEQPTDP
ncbi:uncharacterized protein LOC134060421 [Sardina pilchardus]|uniref:uncharacterized protein LOC134060421 n=1 Tax=Sardina pilchardus TaxID=27697 RepID=UPI002E11142D